MAVYYENYQLEDLPDEKWVDVLGFDGIYEVSSLGRFKSVRREVNTRWGTPRILEERIMKQQKMKDKKGKVANFLWISLNRSVTNVSRLIFMSFFPNVDFKENECVMHINKNGFDNRICNLKKVTRKESKYVDMVKSVRTIAAVPVNLKRMQKARKAFYDNRTHKKCIKCGFVDLKEKFPSNVCKCQKCINEYRVKRRSSFKYESGEKVCNGCGLTKKNKDFPKLDNTCKKCRFEAHKKYQIEQRENLGDWYVKNYGKSKYGYKEFSKEIIDRLRKELIDSRKPKYVYDGKEFKTKRAFAEYIFEMYKIPVFTVLKRIECGFSEYECTLTRKQFINHNLAKKK